MKKIIIEEWLMVIFTAGIFLTGVVAAIIFSRQLGIMKGQLNEMKSGSKQTEESIKITENSMRLNQRAWVGPIAVAAATFKDENNKAVYLKAGSPITFTAIITNSGRSPALKVKTAVNAIDLAAGKKFVPDYKNLPEPAITVIQPNMQLLLTTNPNPALSGSEIDIFKRGEKVIYLFGNITYEDIFQNSHRTTFCLSLAPSLDTFHSCKTYNEAN